MKLGPALSAPVHGLEKKKKEKKEEKPKDPITFSLMIELAC